MGVVPSKPIERVVFYKEKTDATTGPWKLNSTAIGTTSTTVDALNALALTAENAYGEMTAKRNAAKTATMNFHQAVAALSNAGSDVIKAIRAKAAVAGDGVYVLADIPSPAIPSPVGPPGKAKDFKVGLEDNGAPDFSWKCTNPRGAQGTTYLVARQIAGAGEFTFLGATGQKKWTDNTLPAGVASVVYRITAQRSGISGPVADFTVKFGIGGGGEMTATVMSEPPAPKMAA